MIHRPERKREREGCLQSESVAVSAWCGVEAVCSVQLILRQQRHQLRLVITGDRKRRKGDRCALTSAAGDREGVLPGVKRHGLF